MHEDLEGNTERIPAAVEERDLPAERSEFLIAREARILLLGEALWPETIIVKMGGFRRYFHLLFNHSKSFLQNLLNQSMLLALFQQLHALPVLLMILSPQLFILSSLLPLLFQLILRIISPNSPPTLHCFELFNFFASFLFISFNFCFSSSFNASLRFAFYSCRPCSVTLNSFYILANYLSFSF